MNDQHAGIGAVLNHHILKKVRPLLSCGPSAEALPDRDDVIVDRLGQTYHCQIVVAAIQDHSQIRRRCIRVVAPGV